MFYSTLLHWVQGTSLINRMKLRPIIVKSGDSKHKLYILLEYVAQFLRKGLELVNDKFFIYSNLDI
jgi:hypothetical protein